MREQFDRSCFQPQLQNNFPDNIRSCSTIGPSATAQKNVSAPTITITPISRNTNGTPSVGKVPALAAVDFFASTEPSIASARISIIKLPIGMTIAIVTLQDGTLGLR